MTCVSLSHRGRGCRISASWSPILPRRFADLAIKAAERPSLLVAQSFSPCRAIIGMVALTVACGGVEKPRDHDHNHHDHDDNTVTFAASGAAAADGGEHDSA